MVSHVFLQGHMGDYMIGPKGEKVCMGGSEGVSSPQCEPPSASSSFTGRVDMPAFSCCFAQYEAEEKTDLRESGADVLMMG